MNKPRVGLSCSVPSTRISGVTRFQQRLVDLLSGCGIEVVPFGFTTKPHESAPEAQLTTFYIPHLSRRFHLDPSELSTALLRFYDHANLDAVHLVNWLPGGMAPWKAALDWSKPTVFTPTEHAAVCAFGFLLNPCGSACSGPDQPVKCERCTHSLEPDPLPRDTVRHWYSRRHQAFHKVAGLFPSRLRPVLLSLLSEHLQREGAVVSRGDVQKRLDAARQFFTDPGITLSCQAPQQHALFESALRNTLPTRLPLIMPVPPSLNAHNGKAVDRSSRPVSFMFAARSHFDRGLWFLLDAWQRWNPSGNKAVLRLYTEPTNWVGETVAALRKQGCAIELHYGTWTHSDLVDAHRRTHFVVSPSVWQDPGSATVLEGFYLGTPAIVPTETGAADFVHHGVEGYRFRFRDIDSLVETLELATERMVNWDDLGQGALAAARRYDRTTRDYILQYCNLLFPGFEPNLSSFNED